MTEGFVSLTRPNCGGKLDVYDDMKEGFAEPILVRSGLVVQRDEGQARDRFRNRLMGTARMIGEAGTPRIGGHRTAQDRSAQRKATGSSTRVKTRTVPIALAMSSQSMAITTTCIARS